MRTLIRHSAATAGPQLQRRHLVGAALLLPLVACGGGGGGGGAAPGGGGGGGGATPTGRVVTKEANLWVVDSSTGTGTSYAAAASSVRAGVGVSRNGFIADVWDYSGGDAWRIAVRTLAGGLSAEYNVGGVLAFPNSPAVLNADATRMAYSVNEAVSASNSTRLDRTYVNNLSTGALIGRLDNMAEPAFADSGELFARNGTQLHVFDSSLRDTGALPITVAERFGAYSASPDGRYIAYENGSRIGVLDRTTGTQWNATDLAARGHYAPVFSPDGQWLAFLRAGSLALRYVNVIAFVPGTTRTIDDSTELKSASGQSYAADGRIGWSR